MLFVLGLACGFLVALLYLKHFIKKTGAGEMKVCQDCVFKTSRKACNAVSQPSEDDGRGE